MRTGSKISVVLPLASVLVLTVRFARAQPEGAGSGSAAPGTEEATAGPTITGFVDTTYNYNANRPASGNNTYFPYSSQHNNIALNTADLALAGKLHGLSYFVQIDVGSDAAADAYAYGVPTIVDVQEAYVQYTSTDRWGIKAGKFVTYSGIEVIESGANPTISRGYLFSLAEPFTHIGAVATYQLTDAIDVALGAINGWDLIADNNRFKSIVAKLGLNFGDPLALTISTYVGPEQKNNTDHWRATIDVTGVTKLGNATINFQGNAGFEQAVTMAGEDDQWFGFGVQPVWKLCDDLSIGLRGELFRDDKGSRGVLAPEALLFNVSVAPAYVLTPNLVLRIEGRLDVSNKDAFEGHHGPTNNQVVGMAEALASF